MGITVYCPKCKRAVLQADEKAYNNTSVKCRDCHKLVTYHPENREVTLKPVPARHSSGGTRIW